MIWHEEVSYRDRRAGARSKFSTARSCVTPPSAALITDGEMPPAAASCEMLATKVLKSPPQRAAKVGAAMTTSALGDKRAKFDHDATFLAHHERYRPGSNTVDTETRSPIMRHSA
jgi:hypothetical protein